MTTYTREQIIENRKKWIDALRSGEYHQTQRVIQNSNGGMCCLGVAAKMVDHLRKEDTGRSYPDEIVYDMMGLRGTTRDSHMHYDQFTVLNDSRGYSFRMIADYIEKHIEVDLPIASET